MHKPHHKGGRYRPRHRRPLAHGDLRLLILSLIAEAPRHGYDLIGKIETLTGGAYKPSPGVIYPALEILQDLDLAQMIPDGTKKTYQITQDGKALLSDEADAMAQITDRLATLASPGGAEDPSSVRAAMQRLHHTVRSHMRGGVSEAQREKVATILDDARQKIISLDQG